MRVKLRVVAGRRRAETSALINTGFEAEARTLLLPSRLAERLDLWPKLPAGSIIKAYHAAGGEVKIHQIPKRIKVLLLTADKKTEPVLCDAAISEIEDEVLVSDKLASGLKIAIEDPGKGFWRLRQEPIEMVRRSVKPQYW